jgi:hypothetical protein
MSEIKIDVSGQIKLTYDENSKEFQEALESYNESISPNSDAEDMLKHVAFYVTRFGAEGMVEGVGYVGTNGRKPDEEPFSGIMVEDGYDEFEFDVW